ncbi:MAG: hypothetical protein JNK49_13340 [Planctomycetes bacterium]|nr:hypothetical protein [Planctomycetota bacterium]
MRSVPLVFLLSLQTVGYAQAIIVDANNGPGTHYTDLAAAVAAAPEGAMLEVRPGQYNPLQIFGKSLTISFASGAQILTPNSGAVGIEGLGVGQSVFLRGLQFGPYTGTMVFHNNLGFVDVTAAANTNGSVFVQSCDRVRIHGLVCPLGVRVTASQVVFERCSLRGRSGAVEPGLTQHGGSVQLVESTVDGGEGFTSVTAGPAVQMYGGSLRALGGGRLHRGAVLHSNSSTPPPPHAIGGYGTVRVDPSVDLPATQTIGPAIALTQLVQPRVQVDATTTPVTFTANLTGPDGAIAVLAIGFPGASHGAPGLLDPLWWDGPTAVVQAIGISSQSVPLAATLNVPNPIGLAGLRLVWHGLTYEGVGGLQLSPAASGLLP